MEDLDLDPLGYSGSYKLVGGRLSLDLINTISWPRSDREHDWLQTTQNVESWIAAVGLQQVRIADADLPDLYTLRSTITAVVKPLAHGDHPTPETVEDFNTHLVSASGQRRVDPQTLTWSWTPPQTAMDAFAPVVFDAADVVAFADRDRLKTCPGCDWLFLDETRNGRRRWCDMADCGSRAKARSYYHRHKT